MCAAACDMDAPRQAGWERNALSDFLVPEICALFARAYAGEERLDHAEVSPVSEWAAALNWPRAKPRASLRACADGLRMHIGTSAGV